jgi:polyhydroxyalkanoate synthesis regulator phasin
MKTKKSYTSIPERIKPDHVYAYGHALWALSLNKASLEKVLKLKEVFNVGRNLHDRFVDAGIIKKEKVDKNVIFNANYSKQPTMEQCMECYKAQTKKINESRIKDEIKPELFAEEPARSQELTIETLAEQVLKLTEIMNKLVKF